MKNKPQVPPIPVEMHDTVRQIIISALEEKPCSSKELSSRAGIPEKQVYDHLEHIRKTAAATERRLIVTPAECKKCGFVFRKRERFKKPGRCPACRGESIQEPLYSIKEESTD
jgi:predicted Zn-ribbon and HTH transcriptional regulator